MTGDYAGLIFKAAAVVKAARMPSYLERETPDFPNGVYSAFGHLYIEPSIPNFTRDLMAYFKGNYDEEDSDAVIEKFMELARNYLMATD